MKKQEQFLERMTAARARLLAAIESLDEPALSSPPAAGHWSIKDIFGHIVSWNREFRADIELILQGRHPATERHISGEDDFSAWNERWAAEKRDWTWSRVLADFEQDHAEAMEFITRLQPADLRKRGVTPWKAPAGEIPTSPGTLETDSVETLVNYHWRHMNQHAKEIEKRRW